MSTDSSDDEVLGLLATTVAATPPPALVGRILASADRARPAGQPIDALGGGRRADPAAAYIQTVGELDEVLASVDADATIQPYGWTAAQLMAHLLEVELYFGRQLGLWEHHVDESLENDHLAMTAAAVGAATVDDFTELVGRWRRVSSDIGRHVGALDDARLQQRVKFHMLDSRLSTVLVVRVFEVWTHTEDLCRASRRRPPTLDAARLRLMTEAAVGAIPLGMLLAGIDRGAHTARVVLTGPGGGTWNQPLQIGLEPGDPTVTIVAGAVDFCRLAAQRIRPDDLAAEVEGPLELAADVLRGASVFAA